MKSIDFLLKNSNLPGPRGNLELMYKFSKTAMEAEINECFRYYSDDLKNSPEEFVVMCGILGYCYLHHSDIEKTHFLKSGNTPLMPVGGCVSRWQWAYRNWE
jgi:hypothetical protein